MYVYVWYRNTNYLRISLRQTNLDLISKRFKRRFNWTENASAPCDAHEAARPVMTSRAAAWDTHLRLLISPIYLTFTKANFTNWSTLWLWNEKSKEIYKLYSNMNNEKPKFGRPKIQGHVSLDLVLNNLKWLQLFIAWEINILLSYGLCIWTTRPYSLVVGDPDCEAARCGCASNMYLYCKYEYLYSNHRYCI